MRISDWSSDVCSSDLCLRWAHRSASSSSVAGMAIPDLEVLLVIGIVAFYAQDAMMLLYHDELVFERVARRWRPSPGSSQWQGRFLFIPNLLAPWRPLLRGAIPDRSDEHTSELQSLMRNSYAV